VHDWGRPVGDANGVFSDGILPVPIILVDTDEGITGVGLGPHVEAEQIFAAIEGEDPRGVTALYDRMLRQTFKAGHTGAIFGTIGAFDTALWDIKAQAAGEPLWRLLGGRERTVPAYASGLDISLTDEQLVAVYQVYAAHGLRAAKVKGSLDVDQDRHRLTLVRDVLSGAAGGARPALMLDANESWTRKQAVRHVCELEETLDLTWVEEPVRRWDAEGLAIVGRGIRASVASGENLTGLEQFRPLLASGSIDIVQASAGWGISHFLRVAVVAHAHDLPVSPIGNTPVGLLHAATAVPNHMVSELQGLQPPRGVSLDLRIEDGAFVLGDSPGLGIRVDEAAIAANGDRRRRASTEGPHVRPETAGRRFLPAASRDSSASRPGASAEHVIVVAPTGAAEADDDGPGTMTRPLATLVEAQRRARAVAANGDVAVLLLDGTYRLSAPLRFGPADSGSDGHTVTWRAAPGAEPVLSGARSVTGWELDDPATGIYRANVGTGFDTRQLYVDGAFAQRARLSVAQADITISATGFTLDNPGLAYLAGLPDQQRIEFQALQSFTNRFAPVESVSGTNVVMQQPAWDNNTYGYDSLASPFRAPKYFLLNSKSFLDEPGEWYLDTTAGLLFYKPPEGQNMSEVAVELPRLETLVEVGGTYDDPVRNLRFEGLTFTGTTWMYPSTSNGYASQQTGAFIHGIQPERPADAFMSCAAGCREFEAVRNHWWQAPAAVQDHTHVGAGHRPDQVSAGDQALVALVDGIDVEPVVQPCPDHRADGGVHSGGVTAAGEHGEVAEPIGCHTPSWWISNRTPRTRTP
jgi:L-alanine-DL-glutamate epimerase-like enolase superfamily enzyme